MPFSDSAQKGLSEKGTVSASWPPPPILFCRSVLLSESHVWFLKTKHQII